ncbi:prepilin-type N-terminal cleavage/methylation domain-containing protein [Candidatus Peregrinibacteria bacterium]|jgi:prepilin-type N-terminal cleavage/methylation domain-containing protein|nr:prepilin-type N-terminal cleavage/methylation domain-containing protein [Candidatus Peregrinibacteria bacterium]MBT7736402.1 prepilin-type N-terminal cleavage/methylation domain-containing protein [Candidatus Peregrinibacteria bacterium]
MENKKGFTLIEVLLVIVIIAILAGIVIVAINPGRQISQANNTQRHSDVKTMLDAVHEFAIDNRGTFPTGITAVATEVGSGTGLIDICSDLVPTYIAEMPFDPTDADAAFTDCTAYASGYTIVQDATSNRITVAAPTAELTETISVTR